MRPSKPSAARTAARVSSSLHRSSTRGFITARSSGSSSSSGCSAKCQLFWMIDSVGAKAQSLSRHRSRNAWLGAGSSIGTPPPGPNVRTVLCMNSFRPTSRSWTPSASSLMWAMGTSPFRYDSSTIAARIPGGILRFGSATSLIHIFVY